MGNSSASGSTFYESQDLEDGGQKSSHEIHYKPHISPEHPPKELQPLSTKELIDLLEDNFKKWNKIIKTLKKENKYDEETRRYIHTLLNESEKELNQYYRSLKGDELRPNMKDEHDAKLAELTKQLEQQKEESRNQIHELKHELHEKKEYCKRLDAEKQQLVMRLSKMAGDKLVTNNPAIADLNDPNRPTKLGETYSELYDNEWSDAFEGLTGGGQSDEEAIGILRLTLLDAVEFCKVKSKSLLSMSNAVIDKLFDDHVKTIMEKGGAAVTGTTMTMGSKLGPGQNMEIEKNVEQFKRLANLCNKWKPRNKTTDGEKAGKGDIGKSTKNLKKRQSIEDKFVKLRKDLALSLVTMVQKAYIKSSWSDECIPSMKPYIRKCLFVGWLMMVQTPAMSLVPSDVKESDRQDFNKDLYRSFTVNGPVIKYIVWPTMLLHDKGPVILKGVAQCQK